jgi:hypothetical protein
MGALVLDALPEGISKIKTIPENLVEIRAREPKAKLVQHGLAQSNQ